jgi:hypothetical protein
MPPNIIFLPEQSHWPAEIKLTEKFTAQWVLANAGDAGEAFFGIKYKDKTYFILVNGERTFHMDKNQQGTITCETTIKDFFEGVDEFKETTTIEITWLAGYYDASKPEGQQYLVTDQWPVTTLVTVAGLLPVPTWVAVGGVGLGLVAVTGIILTTRKKKR